MHTAIFLFATPSAFTATTVEAEKIPDLEWKIRRAMDQVSAMDGVDLTVIRLYADPPKKA